MGRVFSAWIILLSLCAIVRPVAARCDVPVSELDSDFTVRINSFPAKDPYRTNFVTLLALRLETQGFDALSLEPDERPGQFQFSKLDAIFATPDLDSFIYVKLGVTPNRSKYQNRLFKTPDDYTYLGETPSGVPYLVIFYKVAEPEVRLILSQIVQGGDPANTDTAASYFRNFPWLVPQAFADSTATQSDGGGCQSPDAATAVEGALGDVAVGAEAVATEIPKSRLMTCLKNVLFGMGDGTPVGEFSALFNGGSIEQLKNGIEAIGEIFRDMIHDFRGEMTLLHQAFDNMDPDTRLAFLCRTISAFVTAGAITTAIFMITSGTGGPAAAALLESRTAKIFLMLAKNQAFAKFFLKPAKAAAKFAGVSDKIQGMVSTVNKAERRLTVVSDVILVAKMGGNFTNQTQIPNHMPDPEDALPWSSAKGVVATSFCELAGGSKKISTLAQAENLKCSPPETSASRSDAQLGGMLTLGGLYWKSQRAPASGKSTATTAITMSGNSVLSPADQRLALRAARAMSMVVTETKNPATVGSEMHALVKFIHDNSNDYSDGSALSKQGPYVLKDIYYNPNVPDTIRKMAYRELIGPAKQTMGDFMPDAAMKTLKTPTDYPEKHK